MAAYNVYRGVYSGVRGWDGGCLEGSPEVWDFDVSSTAKHV
jgi:hypothetical protein